jgi:hypothetical protein
VIGLCVITEDAIQEEKGVSEKEESLDPSVNLNKIYNKINNAFGEPDTGSYNDSNYGDHSDDPSEHLKTIK